MLNRRALIKAIHEETDIPQDDIARVLNCLQTHMIHSLVRGIDVSIRGFGRFRVQHCAERMAQNISTGTRMPIPPCKAVRFRPSGELRRYLKLPPGTPPFNDDY